MGVAATNGVDGSLLSSPMDALAASSPTFGMLIGVFSVSAIVTSFWGAAVSLMMEWTHLVGKAVRSRPLPNSLRRSVTSDDTVTVDYEGRQDVVVKFAASVLVLVPPAMVSVACPDSFLDALQYTGIYVDPFLYGLAPTVMAYRFRGAMTHTHQIPGGNASLMFLGALTAGYSTWQAFLLANWERLHRWLDVIVYAGRRSWAERHASLRTLIGNL